MDRKEFKGLLVSDFNITNLAQYLNNNADPPKTEVVVAPYGHVTEVLLNHRLECWQGHPEFVVSWTQPERVIDSYRRLLQGQDIKPKQILDEVDAYASLLLNILDKVRLVFVATWVLPTYHRGLGMLDLKNDLGISHILMRMNLRLSEKFAESSEIYLLNTERWIKEAGKNAFSDKLWYMAKVPYGNGVFAEAAKDIKCALRGINGQAKKLILLDLDHTLWGGIVGDDGMENLHLGGHDPVGEAYVDFQQALKSLARRGILLGIVSKNEETLALQAIQKHPEMVLRLQDFAGWRINWKDKAQNIVDLVSELNLGLQSVVFIDDSPQERSRIREALPEVFVPEWPEDKMLYRSTLLGLHCFDTPSVSQEDRKRGQMYLAEREREDLRDRMGSLEEWLKSLEIKVDVEPVNDLNCRRATQLLNKTNQMNLTTRRMTESEIKEWANQAGHKVWTFRVADRFGDAGLTGMAALEVENGAGRIVDFVLSCRVMGRGVEETMLHVLVEYARSLGLSHVYARYLPSGKNTPCLGFFERSGFANKEWTFIWNALNAYEAPRHIRVAREAGDGLP